MYFIDTGLRNVIAKEFDVESNGKVFENYVFSELLKLGIKPKYWRTKGNAEVDFVIEKEKVGSIWSWKGRHDEYWVTFTESGNTIFESRIPIDADIHLNETKKS